MMRQSRMATRSQTAAPLSRGQLSGLIVLFVVTALCLLMLDRLGQLNAVKVAAERPLLAVSTRFTNAGNAIRHYGDRFGNVEELRAENQALQAQVNRLNAAEAENIELKRQVDQLIQQANFARQFDTYQSVPARIIGRDPSLSEKVLIIDRGSEDGIEKGMPVVSPNFLVGLVSEVSPKRAKIRLLIDQDLQIGVILQDNRGAGIMYGNWQKGGRLTVRHINRDVPVAPNDRIITSNLTNRVPQGLIVGYVASVRKDTQNDSLSAEVIPYVNFDELEVVSVILTNER